MMASAFLLGQGIILGLGAAAPIGPVNIEIVRRALRGGFRAGFFLGCGAVTADVICATLTSFGVKQLLHYPPVYWTLRIASPLLLAFLGTMSLMAAFRSKRQTNLNDPEYKPSAHAGYFVGLGMTLLNPWTLFFWLIVVPGTIGQTHSQDLPIICCGVFIGAIGWVVAFATLIAYMGQRLVRSHWLAWADGIGGIILLGFAVYAFLRSSPVLL